MSEEKKPEEVDILSDKLDEVGRKFTTEIETSAESLRAENKELTERLEKLEEKSRTLVGTGVQDDTVKPISFRKLFLGITSGDWSESGYELEVVQEGRAMGTGTDSLGGYIVPSQYLAGEFIDILRANQVTMAAGARELNGLTSAPIEIGKKTGSVTTYWTAENAAITASDMALGNLTLNPHGLKALAKVSNRLMRMSDPSIEAMLREDIAQGLAEALDLASMKGSGSSGEPLGISNTVGINTKSMNATVTIALLEDMVYELEVDNALKGKLAWVMHPRDWSTTRALLAAQQTAVLDPYGKDGVSGMLWGYPVYTSTQLSITNGGGTDEGDIFFGDWSQLLIAKRGAIEFMASQHADTAFAADQTWIRAVMDVDIGVRQPKSFCYCVDART